LQFAEQAIEAYEKVLELKPEAGQFENSDKNLAQLALGSAYQQKGAILYYEQDLDSALSAIETAIQNLEAVKNIFEASVADHESYRRYLVQSHEYLGTAYQWQGRIFESKQDFDQALPAYQKSIDAFNQCVINGKDSPDLIIQNDIIEKYCQPKLEEIQQLYDELKGGN